MSGSINPTNPASTNAVVQQIYQESLVEQLEELEQQALEQLEQQQLELKQQDKLEELVNDTGATAVQEAQLNKQQSASTSVARSRLRI
jgi:hypothetical protein